MATSVAPSLAAAHADANLLFGVLALQMDFVSRDQLIAGMQAWVGEKSTPLADHLVRSGALKPARRQLLEALVREHVGHHYGNVPASISAIEGIDDIQQDLSRIEDADVQKSAARVAALPAAEMTCVLDNSPSENMRFRILRPHARGGLGEVFVAKDMELGREVALKEIQLERSDDSEARSRFIREAEITGGLEHPGVVPVYSLGTYPDGRPFYAMRFIRGQTLHDAIKAFHGTESQKSEVRSQKGEGGSQKSEVRSQKSEVRGQKRRVQAEKNLELRHLLNQFIDVCQAIDYAHSRGVLHRDLKPANIMLGKYGETLVVDWGLAKASGESKARPAQTAGKSGSEAVQFAEAPLAASATHESEATQMGYVPGTPAYMSPEHALGRLDLMGPASDIFSLGATLYHILTGRPPYVGDNAQDSQRLAQTGSYPPPGKIASVPAPLAAICCKAMAVSPADRYPTAKCLAEDIERYLGDEPVSAYREPLRTRAARWCRRHSRLVATAVICGLIIPICLGSGLFVALQEKRVAQSAEDRAEVRLIAACSILAHDALLSGDHPAAARALKRFPDGRRGWIYEYLHRQLAFDDIVNDEVSTIQCLAMHPGKVRLAYGTQEGAIHLLHPRSGEDKEQFSLPHDLMTRGVAALAYSTTGSQLAVAAGDTVIVYNATALTPLQRVQLPSPVAELLFSPDDQRVIALLRKGPQRVVAFNVADGTVAWKALPSAYENLKTCLSADGKELVVAAGSDISLLQTNDGTLSKSCQLTSGDEATSLLALADGDLVVGTATGTAAVYDVESGQLVRSLDGVAASVTGAQFKNNAWQDQRASIVSAMSIAGSSDVVLLSSAGDVWIANHETGEVRRKLMHKGILAAAGSSGGPLLAMSDQDEIFVFDAARALLPIWKEFRIFPGQGRYPSLSPDGRLIAYAMDDPAGEGEVIVVHDVELGAIRWTAKAQYPHFFRFSRDGRMLAAVCDDLKVFDSESGSMIMQSPKFAFARRDKQGRPVWDSPIQAAVIDPTNRYVAVDGETLQLWEIATARKVAESPVLHVRTVRLSASGDAILGNVEGTIRSWRIPDLKEMHRLRIDQTAASGAAWRITTGRLGDLVAVAKDDNIVQRSGYRWIATAWPSGAPICSFDHDGECLCFDIHPQCRRVVTGGADGKLNVWQYPSGEKLLELPFSRTVAAVKFANNGTRLIAIDKEGKVGIWDSDPLRVEKQE